MWRIEGVSDDTAFGALALGLNNVHGDTGRTRGKDGSRRRSIVHLCEQLDLEVWPLRRIFLDKVCLGECHRHFWLEGQPVAWSAGIHASLTERRPRFVNILPKICLCIRRRVGRDHIESARQVVSRPTCTDDSCANDCYVLNFCICCHGNPPFEVSSKLARICWVPFTHAAPRAASLTSVLTGVEA